MKKTHRISTLVLLLAGILGLASCSGVRKCAPAELNLPQQVAPGAAGDTLTLADIDWWTFYGDSALCHIISRTLENNKNLLAAAARVEELQQLYRIDRAGLFPTLGVNIGANYETNDYADSEPVRDPEYNAKLTLSWEADLWGRLRWAKRAGRARWAASVEDERAMRVTLIAEAATAYFNMLALRNELAIVRRTMDNRAEGVEKARLRFEGGLTSELVYQQAQVEYATTAALVPNIERRIKTTENMLAVLMGAYPGEPIPVGPLTSAEQLSDEKLPLGLPSQLLQRRPDLRAAEMQLRASMAAVGVAWADRFPRLSFSLTGGLENDDIKGFLRSPFSYVAGAIAGPIFEFGKKKASYKAALARYEQSRLAYEQCVLEAFRETDDAVVAFRKVRSTAELVAVSNSAARKYVDLAELQYRGGSINYIEVLDAQRRYFNSQVELSNAVRDENLSLVRLYKALGGGWMDTAPGRENQQEKIACTCPLWLQGQVDAESGSDAGGGAQHVDAAAVILFDDSFCKRKSQAPAAAFRGETGVEDGLEILACYALASVANLDFGIAAVGAACKPDADAAAAFHGVHGIFHQILHHPFQQRRRGHHGQFALWAVAAQGYARRDARRHIIDRAADNRAQVGMFHARRRPDF